MSRSKPKAVPREFAENFELVARFYKLEETGEYVLAKEIARKDLDNAIPSYEALANNVRAMSL